MAWIKGQLLQGGKYIIERELGRGGYGITYLAKKAKNGQLVAIKTPNETTQYSSKSEKILQDFLQEAEQLKKFRHPHIVRFEDLFQEESLWCIVMQYIQGKSLENYVKNGGAMLELDALRYIQQIGEALIEVHKNGLLHRDVNPRNIIVRDGQSKAVLIDFGIARKFTPDRTQTHTAKGSDGYAPIEQFLKKRKRGAYTDVYGLAATLYFLLTAKEPVDSYDRDDELRHSGKDPLVIPKDINPIITKRVNNAIVKGMSLEAKDRPQSIQEWLRLLEVFGYYPQPETSAKPNTPASKLEIVRQLPKIEPLKIEPPKIEPPKIESLKIEPPKIEPPKIESPKIEPLKIESPKIESPIKLNSLASDIENRNAADKVIAPIPFDQMCKVAIPYRHGRIPETSAKPNVSTSHLEVIKPTPQQETSAKLNVSTSQPSVLLILILFMLNLIIYSFAGWLSAIYSLPYLLWIFVSLMAIYIIFLVSFSINNEYIGLIFVLVLSVIGGVVNIVYEFNLNKFGVLAGYISGIAAFAIVLIMAYIVVLVNYSLFYYSKLSIFYTRVMLIITSLLGLLFGWSLQTGVWRNFMTSLFGK